MSNNKRVFLSAEWRHLLMFNYDVDAALLRPYIPAGTELDLWNGRCLISLVCFMFQKTRLLGVPVPFHTNFEEVNLRFYVRRKAEDGWRRGVVFIKELVPRPAIAWTARLVYNENYVALPMRHTIEPNGDGLHVSYGWRHQGKWYEASGETVGEKRPLSPHSEEAFITEHYWGYAKQRNGSTVEYEVQHPPWDVWQLGRTRTPTNLAPIYGAHFADVMQTPCSAFLAEGSPVSVYLGKNMGHG